MRAPVSRGSHHVSLVTCWGPPVPPCEALSPHRPGARHLTPNTAKSYAEREDHPRLQRVQESELLHHEEQAAPSGARRVEEALPALQQASAAQGNEVAWRRAPRSASAARTSWPGSTPSTTR